MRIVTITALVLSLALPSAAMAKGGNHHHHGPHKHWKAGPGGPHRHGPPTHFKKFGFHEHSVIHSYYSRHYAHGWCPPGLAKKRNGCRPPGHAKRCVVGRPLPYGVAWYPVPHDLLVRLTPPPYGYRYVFVDGAVLLFNPATRLVADGVTINIGVNIR